MRDVGHLRGWITRRLRNWIFNRRIVARFLGRDHLLFLGDSHVGVLREVRVPGVWFRPYAVEGATASGILNPTSKTESYKRFTVRLARARRWQQILLLLGEVDCGYLIWHRSERLGLSVEEQLAFTLNSYTTFISRVIGEGFSRVLVLSVPPLLSVTRRLKGVMWPIFARGRPHHRLSALS